jgi:hypothetical protein
LGGWLAVCLPAGAAEVDEPELDTRFRHYHATYLLIADASLAQSPRVGRPRVPVLAITS